MQISGLINVYEQFRLFSFSSVKFFNLSKLNFHCSCIAWFPKYLNPFVFSKPSFLFFLNQNASVSSGLCKKVLHDNYMAIIHIISYIIRKVDIRHNTHIFISEFASPKSTAKASRKPWGDIQHILSVPQTCLRANGTLSMQLMKAGGSLVITVSC